MSARGAGAWTGTQTWTLLPDQWVVEVLLWSPKIICVEFEFFLGLLKTPKLRTAVSWYQPPWSTHWHWWLLCLAACPALLDINCKVTAWKFLYPFFSYSLFCRQGTYWETNVCKCRIVLHLKSVVLHHSASRFRDLQYGIKTLDDELWIFGSSPPCLIFFICSHNAWSCLKSILLITKKPQLAFFLEAFVKLVEFKRDDKKVEAEFIMDSTNFFYGFNKYHSSVHHWHVWFLDPVNAKDFFERFQDYQAKHDFIILEPELFFEVQTIKTPLCSLNVPLCQLRQCRPHVACNCTAACRRPLHLWFHQLQHLLCLLHSGTWKATGISLAAPCDTSRPVAPHTPAWL